MSAPTTLAVPVGTRVSEVWSKDQRFRICTVVVADDDRRHVCFVYGQVEISGGVTEFVRMFSLNQLNCSTGGRDEWEWNLPKADARTKIERWRKNCEKAGFEKLGSYQRN